MSAEDLYETFTRAPCFTSGGLVYLDLSSPPLDQGLLESKQCQIAFFGAVLHPNSVPRGCAGVYREQSHAS